MEEPIVPEASSQVPTEPTETQAPASTQADSPEMLRVLETITEKLEKIGTPAPQPQAPVQEETKVPEPEEDLLWSDPKEYARRLKESIRQDIQKDVQSTIKKQSEVDTARARIIREFPELADSNSAFYKEVDAEVIRRSKEGIQVTPQMVEDIAYVLDRKKIVKGIKAPAAPVKPVPSGGSAPSGNVPQGSSQDLSSVKMEIAKKLGKDENWAKNAYSTIQPGREAVYKRG